MTQDEFKQLQVGDRVTHPAFAEVLVINTVEVSYDYTTRPPTPWTNAITTTTGHRMKIGDERDVRLLQN